MPESGQGSANVSMAESEGQNAERSLPRRGKQASLRQNKAKTASLIKTQISEAHFVSLALIINWILLLLA